MSTIRDSQEQYEHDLANAWKNPPAGFADEGPVPGADVVQHGESVRLSLSMMDSTQQAMAEQFADDHNGQRAYEHRLVNAWRGAA